MIMAVHCKFKNLGVLDLTTETKYNTIIIRICKDKFQFYHLPGRGTGKKGLIA